jgi:hypothetical protein
MKKSQISTIKAVGNPGEKDWQGTGKSQSGRQPGPVLAERVTSLGLQATLRLRKVSCSISQVPSYLGTTSCLFFPAGKMVSDELNFIKYILVILSTSESFDFYYY